MLGGLLVLGHSILAIDNLTAFYGLGFIILGVGGLNQIFQQWSEVYTIKIQRRDLGFKIFHGYKYWSFLVSNYYWRNW